MLWFIDIVHINVTNSGSFIIESRMLSTRYKINLFRWLISGFFHEKLNIPAFYEFTDVWEMQS